MVLAFAIAVAAAWQVAESLTTTASLAFAANSCNWLRNVTVRESDAVTIAVNF